MIHIAVFGDIHGNWISSSYMNGQVSCVNACNESWPEKWHYVGLEHLSLLIELLQPKKCFCAHMHYPAEYISGTTEIVCLSDFSRDPEGGYTVFEM